MESSNQPGSGPAGDLSALPKTAIVTGVTGQDGSYLAELLLGNGYEVHGIVRRASSFNTQRIDHIYEHPCLRLHYGDLTDAASLNKIMALVEPDEVYNLGAQSHVKVSFDIPEYTADVNALGALRLLEAIRTVGGSAKYYQASSSELFGGQTGGPYNEDSPVDPRSPYACSKAFAYHITRNYREAYGLFAVNGILFNHESPRRGLTFVTHKITRAAAAISLGLQKELVLGNLEAERDWGFAGDYAEAMWLMLQCNIPKDYVIATGVKHSITDALEIAFGGLGLDWRKYVKTSPRYMRPSEVDCLLGDATKAKDELGWQPTVGFRELIERMVSADLKDLQPGS